MSEETIEKQAQSNTKSKSKKPKQGPTFDDVDVFGNAFKLPEKFKENLKEAGFDCRFVNAKKLEQENGYHHRGWKPFRTKDFTEEVYQPLGLGQGVYGENPEGVVQRGDAILAVRPLEMTEKHRARIKERGKRHKNILDKAERDMGSSPGVRSGNAKIHSGYED